MKYAVAVRSLAVAVLAVSACCAIGQEHGHTVQARRAASGPPPEAPPVRDPDHVFQLRVRNYVAIRQQNIVMQRRDYSCGAACLATIAKYYWGDNLSEDVALRALDKLLTTDEVKDRIKNGLAMSDLRRAAVQLGYQATVGKTTFEKLSESRVPVIVGISPGGHDHFVVWRGTYGDWVYLADPIRGNIRMPVDAFAKQWQENALLVIHKPGHKMPKNSPLGVRFEEIERGALNDQLIRSESQRPMPGVPPAR